MNRLLSSPTSRSPSPPFKLYPLSTGSQLRVSSPPTTLHTPTLRLSLLSLSHTASRLSSGVVLVLSMRSGISTTRSVVSSMGH